MVGAIIIFACCSLAAQFQEILQSKQEEKYSKSLPGKLLSITLQVVITVIYS